ncbi:MAG: putative membrane protein [Crocinitomicaceae bacterium]|jgi:uncharacterized membrane protein
MESNNELIQELQMKLDILLRRQNGFESEIKELKERIKFLEGHIASEPTTKPIEPLTVVPVAAETKKPDVIPLKKEEVPVPKPVEEPIKKVEPIPVPEVKKAPPVVAATPTPKPVAQKPVAPKPVEKKSSGPSSFEKFLGENLANKIGIAIIVIGIGIGMKYAIDNDWIGPTMRIAIGYLAGAILAGLGFLLKKKYDNFSAVLFGGGMAVAYFVTYLAYDFYPIFSKIGAFGTMLGLTVVTTVAAIKWNKQIIAVIGLVGAYAVPFLLSDGTGTIKSLFIYMTILNLGVLALTFFRGWKALQAVAFGCTWFIFLVLLLVGIVRDEPNYDVFLLFSGAFYIIFYMATIAYKLRHNEAFDAEHITILLLNTMIAYGVGIFLVEELYNSNVSSGLFTIGFAGTHMAAAAVAKLRTKSDIRLFYFTFGMALVFTTISIPALLDGHWITMMWFLEAALLYWIGRAKNTGFFEKIAFIPLGLALISIVIMWSGINGGSEVVAPVLNNYFLTGALFSATLLGMAIIKHQTDDTCDLEKTKGAFSFFGNSLMYLFLIILYFTCFNEINTYWSQKIPDLSIWDGGYSYDGESDVRFFKLNWTLIFTMFFAAFIHMINVLKFKNKNLATLMGILSSILLFIFLTLGLYSLSVLRDRGMDGDNMLEGSEGMYFNIRYYALIALVAMSVATTYALKKLFNDRALHKTLEIILHGTFVWFMSSEIVHWRHMQADQDYYRTGLSILWGVYSFALIAFGIWKRKPHLRIIGLIIFGVTLLKLFLYDIAYSGTGSKTIAFISLGILLLVISFLYNKYKHLISDEEEEAKEPEKSQE